VQTYLSSDRSRLRSHNTPFTKICWKNQGVYLQLVRAVRMELLPEISQLFGLIFDPLVLQHEKV
jgi:hypothetical protein